MRPHANLCEVATRNSEVLEQFHSWGDQRFLVKDMVSQISSGFSAVLEIKGECVRKQAFILPNLSVKENKHAVVSELGSLSWSFLGL